LIADPQIRGTDVAVDDFLRVKIGEAERRLLDQLACFEVRNPPLAFQPLFQPLSAQRFQCDKRHRSGLADLIGFHNVRIVDLQRDARFASEARQSFRVVIECRRKDF
jgi:hypothetical protein